MGKLEGKVAIVSGGTSGMGEAAVRRFVAEGAKVVFFGRREELGKAIEKEVGENCTYVKADVKSEEDWKRVVDTAVNTYGDVTVLLNNAGYCPGWMIADGKLEDFKGTAD